MAKLKITPSSSTDLIADWRRQSIYSSAPSNYTPIPPSSKRISIAESPSLKSIYQTRPKNQENYQTPLQQFALQSSNFTHTVVVFCIFPNKTIMMSTPLFFASTAPSSSSSLSYCYTPTVSASKFSCLCKKPIYSVKVKSWECKRSIRSKELQVRSSVERPFAEAGTRSDMPIREEDEEENPSSLLDSEMNSRPRRIALFVEPSPFASVSYFRHIYCCIIFAFLLA